MRDMPPTVDFHNDLPLYVWKQRKKGKNKVIESLYYNDIKAGGVSVIVAPIFLENEFLPEMATRSGLSQLMSFIEDVEESPELMCICVTAEEVRAAAARGKVAFILAFEGLEPIQTDLGLLKAFYKLGVRVCGLTWSRRNFVSDGCGFGVTETEKKSGLTAFGREAVTKALDLGMLLDVSHISEEGFWDTLSLASGSGRVIASHTCCRTVNNIMRNFSDEQIKALAAAGGVIGINGVSKIASPGPERNSLDTLVDHIEHITQLVGIEHVGYGFDLYTYYKNPDFELPQPTGGFVDPPDLLPSYPYLNDLEAILARRGFSQADIDKVRGGNWMRVLRQL